MFLYSSKPLINRSGDIDFNQVFAAELREFEDGQQETTHTVRGWKAARERVPEQTRYQRGSIVCLANHPRLYRADPLIRF
jgi:hypothetical protein